MRLAILVSIAASLAGTAASSAQRLGDPLPLRPGGIPDRIVIGKRCPALTYSVDDCSPVATLQSIPAELVAIDGALSPFSTGERNRALIGEIGSSVTLTYRTERGLGVKKSARSDVFSPDSSFTGLVLTPHFAVHHRPVDVAKARSVAADAERLYLRSGFPQEAGGRRAHLWLLQDYAELLQGGSGTRLEEWGAWVTGDYDPDLEYGNVITYIAYGFRGTAGQSLGSIGLADTNLLHRTAVAELLGNSTWLDVRLSSVPVRGSSLREYIREQYGPAKLQEIWQSHLGWDASISRTLGMSQVELTTKWRRHIFSLGPNPDVGPAVGVVGAMLAWTALLLFAGVFGARRREVG